MHLGNPSEGSIPIALFCYGEKRKFIRVCDDYQNTVNDVRRAFGIAGSNNSITLQTSMLDVCKGRDVAIDKSAYPLMWTFLDEITVTVDQEDVEEPTASSSRREEKAPEVFIPPPESPYVEETATTGPSSTLHDVDVPPQVEEEARREEKRWEDQIWEQELNEEASSPVEESTHHGRSVKEPEPEIHAPKKFKAATSNDASSSRHEDIFPRVKQEKTAPPLNDEAPKRERSPRKDNQTPPAADDPRFEIAIIGPGNAYAQFKTRGKHQVRKVLAAACKTFDIDESCAQLVHSLSIEDEDGEMQDHHFVCVPEETIQGSGVHAGSKLFIKVRPENEDEASD